MARNEKRWSAETNTVDDAATRAGAAFGLEVAYLDEPCFESVDEARAYMDDMGALVEGECVLLAQAATEMGEPTSRYKAAKERYHRYIRGSADYERSNSIHSRKSSFITCKGCGSHLRVSLIPGNSCPLCGNELRSGTVMRTLERWQERIARAHDETASEALKFMGKRVWIARRYAPQGSEE